MSVYAPLMTGTMVSYNSGILASKGNLVQVSRLVALETCSLPWLVRSPKLVEQKSSASFPN